MWLIATTNTRKYITSGPEGSRDALRSLRLRFPISLDIYTIYAGGEPWMRETSRRYRILVYIAATSIGLNTSAVSTQNRCTIG